VDSTYRYKHKTGSNSYTYSYSIDAWVFIDGAQTYKSEIVERFVFLITYNVTIDYCIVYSNIKKKFILKWSTHTRSMQIYFAAIA